MQAYSFITNVFHDYAYSGRIKVGEATCLASNAVKKKTAADAKPAAKKSSTSGSTKGRENAAAGTAKKNLQEKKIQEPVQDYANPFLMKEAVMWLILAFCILLFISYFGIGGYVGGIAADISFGIFGVCAYLFPFLLFMGAAFVMSNRGNRLVGLKLTASILLYLCVCGFAGLLDGGYADTASVMGLYDAGAAYKSGGGLIGGGACLLIAPALGKAGMGVLLLILSIICAVLITQRSLLRTVKHQSSRMMESARQSSERRREAHMQERRRREEWKQFEELSVETSVSKRAGDRPEHPAVEKTIRVERVAPDPDRRRRVYTDPYGSVRTDAAPYEQRNGQSRVAPRVSGSGRAENGRISRGTQAQRHADTAAQSVSFDLSAGPGETQPGQSDVRPVRSRSGRTEIEVPVIFPVNGRESRSSHRVSGVTFDTKLPDTEAPVAAEAHEIRPKTASSTAHAELTSYIDLETPEYEEKRPESVTTVRPLRAKNSYESAEQEKTQDEALMSLHIEGLEPEADAQHVEESRKEDGPVHNQAFWKTQADMQHEADEKDHVKRTIRTEEQISQFGYEEMDPAGANEETADFPDEGEQTDASVGAPRIRENKELSEPVPDRPRHVRNLDIFRSDASEDAPSSAGTVFRSAKAASGAERTGEGRKAAESSTSEVPARRNPRSSQQEIAEGIASVEEQAAETAKAVRPEYVFPPVDLLKKGKNKESSGQEQEIKRTAAKLQQTLNSFGVHVTVTNVSCGPSVTRYELLPEQGVKVSKIVGLSDDIKLNLAAADIRIEAPIPGKAAVGIEVPNAENSAVALRDLIESDAFKNHPSKLAFATGKDIGGKVVVSDIAKMPHLLIAGATGSGKSVCINTLIMSILYKAHPDDVKLIMIDPKVVELSVYNGIPHLFIPVVTDPKKAAGALNWGVAEMTDRYNKFAEYGVRDLKGYNQKVEALKDIDDPNKPKKLPQIVIIVDELADLMMVAPGEVEDSICRLAQLARAAGIHLIIATQRPSVNVITGLIKANMPSRIAFSVSSGVDSRTILDMNGAEKLLGKGDMLFYPQGYQKPARVQGALVTDEEVADVVDFLKNKNMDPTYSAEMQQQIEKVQQAGSSVRGAEDTDGLFADAGKFIIEKDKASIGMLQRVFKIGFNRAARIMDQLSDAGVVGPEEGTKPRKILMSAEQFENYLEEM